jgi:hypothetical protein
MNTSIILDEIERNGIFYTKPMSSEQIFNAIEHLELTGVIESIADAGIQFMNNDWAFIKRGNPDGIYVKTEGPYTYLCKPELGGNHD